VRYGGIWKSYEAHLEALGCLIRGRCNAIGRVYTTELSPSSFAGIHCKLYDEVEFAYRHDLKIRKYFSSMIYPPEPERTSLIGAQHNNENGVS
jgi:hypothetical protein